MARIFRALTRFSKTEIDRAFATARRVVREPHMTILVSLRQGEFARILPVISRKVGNSPARNKLRRRLKTIFFEQRYYEGAYDLIVLTRPGAAELSFDELDKLLIMAIGRAAELPAKPRARSGN